MTMLSKRQAYRKLIRPLSLLGICLIAGFLLAFLLSPAYSEKLSMDSIAGMGVFVGLAFAWFFFSPILIYQIVDAVQARLARMSEMDWNQLGSDAEDRFQKYLSWFGIGLFVFTGSLIFLFRICLSLMR